MLEIEVEVHSTEMILEVMRLQGTTPRENEDREIGPGLEYQKGKLGRRNS